MPTAILDMLVDRVDNEDRVIGTVKRKDVFQLKANFRVVHFFIFNKRGELLLQQLGPEHPRHPGYWGSSVAGYVAAGETYEEAGRRKLSEELRISGPFTNVGKTWMNDQGCKKFITLYTMKHDGPFQPERGHVGQVKFLPVGTIETGRLPGTFRLTDTFTDVFRFYLDTVGVVR